MIREAIRKLELEGLVVMAPRKGAKVASITERDLNDVLEVRKGMEELAIRLACERITPEQLDELDKVEKKFLNLIDSENLTELAEVDVEFHDIIYASTNNKRLIQLLNNLREQMYRYRVEYLKDERNYPTLMREHNEIVEGLMTKDKVRVTEAMHKHVKNQVVAVKEMIREQE